MEILIQGPATHRNRNTEVAGERMGKYTQDATTQN
jgi:hypothetical protein